MSEGKIIKYITCKDASASELDSEVTAMLEEGWELYGPPYTMAPDREEGSVGRYCQAMVMRFPVTVITPKVHWRAVTTDISKRVDDLPEARKQAFYDMVHSIEYDKNLMVRPESRGMRYTKQFPFFTGSIAFFRDEGVNVGRDEGINIYDFKFESVT
jgi:hypothetical protein